MKLLELFNDCNTDHYSKIIFLEKKRGIIHIEDLPVDEFINKLRNIKNLIISEKIDGANLRFGVTRDGKFFTSREAKGGKRFFSVNDYGNRFADVGFKSAHAALEKVYKKLIEKKLLFPGEIIEVEILFGKLPNAVPYTGDTNRIILLRPIVQEDSTEEEIRDLENRLERIKDFLKDYKVIVEVENVPYTDDGERIYFRNEKHVWSFSKTPLINIENFVDREELEKIIDKSLNELEEYLKSDSGIGDYKNYEILAFSIRNKPGKEISNEEWKNLKEKVENKKKEILENIYNIKIKVKKDLLINFVRKIKSEFGPDISEGGWIEGIVLRDPVTGEQFKIVDKDFFTKINKFNWRIRSLLKTNMAAKKANDFSGKLRERISDVLKLPEYRMRITWYNFLNNLKTKNIDPVNYITERIGRENFEEIKSKLIKLLIYHRKILKNFLRFYDKNKEKLILRIDSDNQNKREFKYNEEIDRRTKQSFAELFKYLDETMNEIKNSKNLEQIIRLIVGSDEDMSEN